MEFKKALEFLKKGKKIKRKDWGGYWLWCEIHGDILMFCKGGQVIPLTHTKSVLFTVGNMAESDWEVVE